MKTFKIFLSTLLLSAIVILSSCRTEESIFIQAPLDEQLKANSVIASLMQRTATNDGSSDNIIDSSNCFNVQLPVTVIANGIEIIVTSEEGLVLIEAIFDEFDDDDNVLDILFPITIILADYSEIVLNNISELNEFSSNCNGEDDDDIECIDFVYPITASIFNTSNELIETITIENDSDLYHFIAAIDPAIITVLDFPITVTIANGEQITINNFTELKNAIENALNDCDEDDDNDWNDDDCDHCTDTKLIEVLTSCTKWMVDKLERNDKDLEDIYVGYAFDFLEDGSLTVTTNNTIYSGTWEADGTANGIIITIAIPDLPDFNNSWNLHELDEETHTGGAKVDLRLHDDRLRFESDCDDGGANIDDAALVEALTDGDWFVTYYFDGEIKTQNYNDYVFKFNENGTCKAIKANVPTEGSWSISVGDHTPLELNLNFGTTTPLDMLADDWDVLEVTDHIIRLKDVSDSNGSIDFLTFERTQGTTGSGTDNLKDILSEGLWFVFNYTDHDDQNLTANYDGFLLNFNSNGTVVANHNNGTEITGIWEVENSGNIIGFDFESDEPFDEFEEEWDVISVTNTEIILQHVSGGNGGTDRLKLKRQ